MTEALNKARAEYERASQRHSREQTALINAEKNFKEADSTFNLAAAVLYEAEAALKKIETTSSDTLSVEDIIPRILRDIDSLIELAQKRPEGNAVAILRLEFAREQITKVCISQ